MFDLRLMYDSLQKKFDGEKRVNAEVADKAERDEKELSSTQTKVPHYSYPAGG